MKSNVNSLKSTVMKQVVLAVKKVKKIVMQPKTKNGKIFIDHPFIKTI